METLEQYIYRHHTDKTAKTYLYYLDVFKMQQPNAKALNYNEITKHIEALKKNKTEVTQISPILSAIKRYYDYLLETGQRQDHPCRNLKLQRKKKPIQTQDLFTPTELEQLMNRENRFANLELRNKVVISLLIYQALACSELCRLTLSDVDLDAGTIYIKGSPKFAARTLELKPSQIKLLLDYINTSRKNLLRSATNSLLITQRGVVETVDGIHSMIEPLKHLYPERNLNPTTIRQSVIANKLNISKENIEDVQLFAGHKWPSSTEQYKRTDINEQLEKINMWHPLK